MAKPYAERSDTRARDSRKSHRLSLYECHSGIVLTQRAVQSKENEISAAAALVHPALVKGRLLSTDAMHTQKQWCACVHGYGGYYLTIVKKNQPQMYQDLVDFFDDPDAEQEEWQYAKSVRKGHGRLAHPRTVGQYTDE
jgi:predicted transposase YbfD/YdcC